MLNKQVRLVSVIDSPKKIMPLAILLPRAFLFSRGKCKIKTKGGERWEL